MTPWRILDYWPREGSNLIRAWGASQDPEVCAAFDVAIGILEQTPEWDGSDIEGVFRLLKHDQAGLGEIVFDVDVHVKGRKPTRRRFRVFVIPRPDARELVLLLGSEKQRGTYIPPDAPTLAFRLLEKFRQGQGWTDEHI